MQDDDGAMLRAERLERPLQGIAIVDRDGLVAPARSVDREGANVAGPPPVPAELLVTGVHDEPVEPDLEALGVTQLRKLAPREEECLLDGVLGPLDIAQDPVRDGVAPVTVQVESSVKATCVALPRAASTSLVRTDEPRGCARWALQVLEMVRRPKGSATRRAAYSPP